MYCSLKATELSLKKKKIQNLAPLVSLPGDSLHPTMPTVNITVTFKLQVLWGFINSLNGHKNP